MSERQRSVAYELERSKQYPVMEDPEIFEAMVYWDKEQHNPDRGRHEKEGIRRIIGILALEVRCRGAEEKRLEALYEASHE